MASDSKLVRVGYPYSALHHHIDGVPDPITDEWSSEPVGGEKLAELRRVAKDNATPLEERADSVDSLNKDELVERAASLGVSTEGTKPELVERVREAEANS
jgi:hypothetical protein